MDVLPLESNLTVLSSRSAENDFNRLKSALSGRRPDLITTKLSNEFINLAGVRGEGVRVYGGDNDRTVMIVSMIACIQVAADLKCPRTLHFFFVSTFYLVATQVYAWTVRQFQMSVFVKPGSFPLSSSEGIRRGTMDGAVVFFFFISLAKQPEWGTMIGPTAFGPLLRRTTSKKCEPSWSVIADCRTLAKDRPPRVS